MLQKFGQVLLIVAVLAATGSHWIVLQSVAWTTMLADNLQNQSFTEAVQRTFDGKHPCCLCKEIAKGKQSEKKSEFQVELKKLEFSYTPFVFVFAPPLHFWEVRVPQNSPPLLVHSPPIPPPKEFLG